MSTAWDSAQASVCAEHGKTGTGCGRDGGYLEKAEQEMAEIKEGSPYQDLMRVSWKTGDSSQASQMLAPVLKRVKFLVEKIVAPIDTHDTSARTGRMA